MHPVVAQRQIGRHHETRFAHQPIVEGEWRGEIVHLPDVAAYGAVLQPDPHLGRVTVGDVDPEAGFGTGAAHDRRRQTSGPVTPILLGKNCNTIFFSIGFHPEGGQDGDHRRGVDRLQMAHPVVVLGRHAQPTGDLGQRRTDHVCHLACYPRTQRSEPDKSMVNTPHMISTMPAIISGVRRSENKNRPATATSATPHAVHMP